MRKQKFKFGLRTLMILVIIAATFLAIRYPSRRYSAADLEIGPFNLNAAPGMATSPAEDHCLRIRSLAIIETAIQQHPEIKAFAGPDPVRWVHQRLHVFPRDDNTIRVMMLGRKSNQDDMELVVGAVAEAYRDFHDSQTGKPPTTIQHESKSIAVLAVHMRDSRV